MARKDSRCVAFGLAVRTYREALNLTQEQLAGKAGIHRTYIGGIERGERNPTLLMIHRLAGALGISAVRLFEEDRDRSGETT